jgi:hypothetical protein
MFDRLWPLGAPVGIAQRGTTGHIHRSYSKKRVREDLLLGD